MWVQYIFSHTLTYFTPDMHSRCNPSATAVCGSRNETNHASFFTTFTTYVLKALIHTQPDAGYIAGVIRFLFASRYM